MRVALDVPQATPTSRRQLARGDRPELGTPEAKPVEEVEAFTARKIERFEQRRPHGMRGMPTTEGRHGEAEARVRRARNGHAGSVRRTVTPLTRGNGHESSRCRHEVCRQALRAGVAARPRRRGARPLQSRRRKPRLRAHGFAGAPPTRTSSRRARRHLPPKASPPATAREAAERPQLRGPRRAIGGPAPEARAPSPAGPPPRK